MVYFVDMAIVRQNLDMTLMWIAATNQNLEMKDFVVGITRALTTKEIVITMEIAKKVYYVEITIVQVHLGLMLLLIAVLMLSLKSEENFNNIPVFS